MPTNDLISTKKDLILSEDFEKALGNASDVRKSILTSVKSRNRDNFDRFYEIMLTGNQRIQSILDKKAKDRTEDEKKEVKDFKTGLKRSYKMVVDILLESGTETEGNPTIVQKLVERISSAIFLLKYLGNGDFQTEFAKKGITVGFRTLEDQSEVFENENIRKHITEVFENGKKIKDETESGKQEISETIFQRDIPEDLQFDKDRNPCGIKPSDFIKLVDMKTKIEMAREIEQKEKANEQATGMAEEKEFEIARSRIVQAKFSELADFSKIEDERAVNS